MANQFDYHVHSTYSHDGGQSIFEACSRAVALGLDEICFTEHLDPHPPAKTMTLLPDFAAWSKEIDEARQLFPSLTIRKGVEIGDCTAYREELCTIIAPLQLDFHLLSLHLIDGIDPWNTIFYQDKTQQQAYTRYLEYQLESIQNFTDYDALAHLGYISKFAPYPKEARPMEHHHGPEMIDTILKTLVEGNKALEINASGLRETAQAIPSNSIIKRYIDLGGQWFTFSSDAHNTTQIYQHVALAKKLALAQGAKWELTFKNRRATPIAIG